MLKKKKKIDTSNYELEYNFTERPVSKGKNKKLVGLMKDELSRKSSQNLLDYEQKLQLIDEGSEDKKARGTQKSFS